MQINEYFWFIICAFKYLLLSLLTLKGRKNVTFVESFW